MAYSAPARPVDDAEHSVFFYPWPYRLVLVARSTTADLATTGLFFAGALWYEAEFNHARPAYLQIVGTSGWLRWWVDHAMIAAPPAAISAVLFAVGIRTDRIGFGFEPSLRWLRVKAALYAAAALLAAWSLARCPGGLLARYVPLAVAM